MRDLDRFLHEALRDGAHWGDPDGVVDEVRRRVAVGDPGTTADSGGPFAGHGGRFRWAVAGTVVAVGSMTLGATGLLEGTPTAPIPSYAAAVGATEVVGLDCPGGRPVVSFRSGDRVLVMARSSDAAYVAVRSPVRPDITVWVATAAVTADAGAGAVHGLPESGCTTGRVLAQGSHLRPPAATESADPERPDVDPEDLPSATGSKSAPPAAGQPSTGPATEGPTHPSPGGGNESPPPNRAPTVDALETIGTPFCNLRPLQISAKAGDDHAVASMTVSWTGAESGSGTMTRSMGSWHYTLMPAAGTRGDITVTVTAHDAEGLSASRSATVHVDCLI
ncbi:Ig-like domain-containing protein [Nocardioides sp. AE5]|uniref:Ig-like domain-containing protein n=1 Tax=Nocardioides sp. AE5 TaxID=2962573 RepID=UPI0028812F73|nr:hypothetical protein [Nocardioides sp. AE5]MDT0202752.1 hypothetical protein [Nocardioides sp. AE5]